MTKVKKLKVLRLLLSRATNRDRMNNIQLNYKLKTVNMYAALSTLAYYYYYHG